MLRGFIQEPASLVHVPAWVLDAKLRKDPLAYRRPWWNYRAIAHVGDRLAPGNRVFEFGAGGSTLWLIDRAVNLTSIEHDATWYRRLLQQAPSADLRLVIPAGGDFSDYIQSIDAEQDASIDLVIVDGCHRPECLLRAVPKVRPGGMLLLDDTQASDLEPPDRRDLSRMRSEFAHLPDCLPGWRMTHMRGLKPGTWLPVQTTFWEKPRRFTGLS